MLKKVIERNKILFLAIAASLAWHLACLSVCAIVAPPSTAHPVTFSKVAFLGLMPERGSMEVRVSPRERTFLEGRYLERFGGIIDVSRTDRGRVAESPSPADSKGFAGRLRGLIDEAVSGQKLVPRGDV